MISLSTVLSTIDNGDQEFKFEFEPKTASKITLQDFMIDYLPSGGSKSSLRFVPKKIEINVSGATFIVSNSEFQDLMNTTLWEIVKNVDESVIFIKQVELIFPSSTLSLKSLVYE